MPTNDRRVPWVGLVPTMIGLCGLVFVWLLPLVTIARYAIAGPSDAGFAGPDQAVPLAAPPEWFDVESTLSRWPGALFRSLRLSLLTSFTATFCGLALAFALARCKWPVSGPFRFLWAIGLFLPLPIVATIWLGAFSNLGRTQAFGISERPLVAGWQAAWVVHTIAALPLVVTILAIALRRTDPDLEDFARLQYPPRRAIPRSTLRSILPAIGATNLVVLIVTAGDMTVTDLVQERTFAEETYLQAQMGDGLASAARTALPITLMVTPAILLWLRFQVGRIGPTVTRRGFSHEPRPWYDGRLGGIAGLIVCAVTLLIGLIPIGSLAWRAGRSGGAATIGQFPRWSAAALFRNLADAAPDISDTTFWTISVACVVAMGGTVLAWCMVSSLAGREWGRITLVLAATLGLAIPGPVAGLGVLWLWMPIPALYDSPFVIVAAILFRFLGIAVFLLWAASRSIARDVRESASLDGLSVLERFRRLEWPVMSWGAAASSLCLFAFSAGELPATNMTVPPGVEMMSVRLWSLMHTGMESHLAAFVLLLTNLFSICVGVLIFSLLAVLRRLTPASRMIE